jgi:hypothetical protein
LRHVLAVKRIGEWTVGIIKQFDTALGFEIAPQMGVEYSVAVAGRQKISNASAVSWAPGHS